MPLRRAAVIIGTRHHAVLAHPLVSDSFIFGEGEFAARVLAFVVQVHELDEVFGGQGTDPGGRVCIKIQLQGSG